MEHLSLGQLQSGLNHVRQSPRTGGRVELIVRRPAENERELPAEAALDTAAGLVGDNWRARGSRHTPDGAADPLAQLTLMNARVAALVAGAPERRQLAGDQLYVDFDLSVENLPPGTRLQVGTAVLEVSTKPHRGCVKFSARFGNDALRFVNSPDGIALNLRGINTFVVSGGVVRVGDTVSKLDARQPPQEAGLAATA